MTHPSRLTLDLALIGAAPAADAAHIAACARCHAALVALDEKRQAFLEAHPTPPPRSAERVAPARSASEPRSPRRRFPAAAVIAAAAAIIALAFLLRPPPDKARMKGATHAELWIKRSTQTFAFDGRPLQRGDTLVFRYTTERKHLTVIDAEASGKIEVVIDQAIEPGNNRTAPKGVALDDYTGEERVIAFFSDAPLDVEKLRADPEAQPPDTDRSAWRIERSAP